MQNHSNGRRQGRPSPFKPDEAPISLKTVNWGRLLGYLKPYRGRMSLAILALLISTGAGLAFPPIIVRLLSSVTQTHALSSLNMLGALLVGVFLCQAAFNFLQSYLLAYIGEHIVYDLRTSLYSHLQELSLDFYSVRRVGDLVSRLSSDVTQMRTMLTTNLTSLLSQAVTLIGSIVIVLTMNARFTLFILALVPVLILVAFTVRQPHPEGQHAHPGPVGRFDHRGRRRAARHPRGKEFRARGIRNSALRRRHGEDLPRLPAHGGVQLLVWLR